MKRPVKMLAAAVASAICMANIASAQDWQRQMLFDIVQGNQAYGDLDLAFQKLNESIDATNRGDWSAAKDAYVWLASRCTSEPDVNRADNFVAAAMCAWNLNYSSEAEEYLNKAIDKMRYGQYLGGGCEARAVAFRDKMREGKWPSTFTSDDILHSTGIHSFVMQAVKAKFNSAINSSIARSNAMIGMMDAQQGIYEAEGRWHERQAKFYARQEYQKETGKTFDPYNPPSLGTAEREKWNSAKRIYDIFGD